MSVVFFTDRDLGLQFPSILRDAGLRVERHGDHFAPDSTDEAWLRHMSSPRSFDIASPRLVVVGHAPNAELARAFVATALKRGFHSASKIESNEALVPDRLPAGGANGVMPASWPAQPMK